MSDRNKEELQSEKSENYETLMLKAQLCDEVVS